MSNYNRRTIALASLFALSTLALAPGCGDDNDNPKPNPIIPVARGGSGGKADNTGGKAGSNSGGSQSDAGTPASEGGTGASDGEGGNGAQGGDTTVTPPACDLPERGADGCYNCPEDNEPTQWLNRCVSGSKCEPFDNSRVKLLEADGSLPPFPT